MEDNARQIPSGGWCPCGLLQSHGVGMGDMRWSRRAGLGTFKYRRRRHGPAGGVPGFGPPGCSAAELG